MANHGTAALILIASLFVAFALSGANARVVIVRRDANGSYYALEKEKAAPAVPELTCKSVHGVQAGETCSSLAEGSKLTQENFLAFNPNINCEDMFVGQWVCLKAIPA